LQKTVELGEFENATPRVAQRSERPRASDLLGFSAIPITPDIAQRLRLTSRTGVIVHEVDEFSGAASYLIPGTQVLRINNREVNSVQDVERIAESLKPGQVVTLVVTNADREPRIINYRVR
jgi:S1-C subfamily serine protease